MRLLIVRHGATDHNVQARYTGQSDVSLSSLGELQAEALGRRLAAEKVDAIISSDLTRARSTAEVIVRYNHLPITQDPDLREISMGEWEGLTYAEVWERDPEYAARWQRDPLSIAAPGGETAYQLRDRVVRAFDRWRGIYPEANVLWVTHGGVIGVLLCQLLGMDLSRRWQFRRDNTAINELDVGTTEGSDGENYYAIVMRLNDACHLAATADGESTVAEARQVL
ncbi:MAG: alpha-ribazole phosphatase [Ktedonobacterales bacterium]